MRITSQISQIVMSVMKDKLSFIKYRNPADIWGGFDRIYLIHYVGYEGRMDAMREELKRIGIWGRGNFCVKETVRTEQEKKIPNGGTTDSERNLALAHSEIIADAKLRNCKKILVLEDDVRFLKDVNLLYAIMDSLPDNGYVNLDPIPITDERVIQRWYSSSCQGFTQYNETGVWGTSAYCVFHDAIDYLFSYMNETQQIPIADHWEDTNAIRRYMSIINICCQIPIGDCISNDRNPEWNASNLGYKLIGLNKTLYNI